MNYDELKAMGKSREYMEGYIDGMLQGIKEAGEIFIR